MSNKVQHGIVELLAFIVLKYLTQDIMSKQMECFPKYEIGQRFLLISYVDEKIIIFTLIWNFGSRFL